MTTKPKADTPTGLDLLRMPFPAHQISKLPKETKAQIDQRKADRNYMVFNCPICGGHHHKNAVHLDYVGHAALTDRLLDCDPHWDWEPYTAPGLPNPGNGMWIKLTVCGQSRIGYGHADGKSGGDAIKEIVGDALRNAAMRFGAALDLWHKGDLHIDEEMPEQPAKPALADDDFAKIGMLLKATNTEVGTVCKAAKVDNIDQLSPAQAAKVIEKLETKLADMAKAKTNAAQPDDDLDEDSIPY